MLMRFPSWAAPVNSTCEQHLWAHAFWSMSHDSTSTRPIMARGILWVVILVTRSFPAPACSHHPRRRQLISMALGMASLCADRSWSWSVPIKAYLLKSIWEWDKTVTLEKPSDLPGYSLPPRSQLEYRTQSFQWPLIWWMMLCAAIGIYVCPISSGLATMIVSCW